MTDKEWVTFILLPILAIIAIVLITGCSSTPTKAFNTEDQQDYSCYTTFGNELGYCTK